MLVLVRFINLRIIVLLTALFTSSCVTYVYPVGKWDDNWAEPVDLALHEASLAGVIIQIKCQDQSQRDTSSQYACISIKQLLKSLSATIVDAEGRVENDAAESSDDGKELTDSGLAISENAGSNQKRVQPEVIVQYSEIEKSGGMCGWSMIPMLMTGGFVPCLAEGSSKAKLAVTNMKTGRTQSWPLELKTRSYNGFGALFFLISDGTRKLSRSEYKTQLRRNLSNFIRNKVYTAATLQGGSL